MNSKPKDEAVVRLLLRAYNEKYIHPPISDRELDSIIHSIGKAEASIENQIKERMAEYGDTREQAREALENVNVEVV